MAWYLAVTKTRMIAPTPGAEKERGEFAVERQLADMGIEAWCPRKIEFKRQGKRRRPDVIVSPYLPGYIFADIPAAQFHEAINVRGMGSTVMAIHPSEMKGQVRPFQRAVQDENAQAERIIERNDRAAMCQFKPGQAIDVLAGPFAERVVSFRAMCHAGNETWLEGEAEIFGRLTRIKLDPLDVKAAE